MKDTKKDTQVLMSSLSSLIFARHLRHSPLAGGYFTYCRVRVQIVIEIRDTVPVHTAPFTGNDVSFGTTRAHCTTVLYGKSPLLKDTYQVNLPTDCVK